MKLPALYGDNNIEACRVLPPGYAIFPDLKEKFSTVDRQKSDSVDGYFFLFFFYYLQN